MKLIGWNKDCWVRFIVVGVSLLAAACNGGGRSQQAASATEAVVDPVHSFANACYSLRTAEGYVSQADAAYGLTDNPSAAASFYFKPSRLGAYLLMSDYNREADAYGNKALLGISDPAGEFLDTLGNLVAEVSYVVSGIGDITEALTDPIQPGTGPVRGVGEIVGGLGDVLGDQSVAPGLALVTRANDLAVWALLDAGDGFQLASDKTGLMLAVEDGQLGLTAPENATQNNSVFQIESAPGCTPYPEAQLNAKQLDTRGPAIYMKDVSLFNQGPAASSIDNDDVFGFVDAHSHITAYEFIGGRVNYGDPFHKFGVDHALEDCAVNHGPQGTLGVVENFTSQDLPVGQHATRGWPDFPYWPRNDSLQHHQSYYKWLERAHLAGLKILVNNYTGSEVLCQLNPQKQNACDFEENWRLQSQRLYEMQDYIDAQNGGPGQGWFRIVDNPADARQVIDQGKMAVVIGIEISKIFNCGEFLGQAECSRKDIKERLDAAYNLGVRHIFPMHKFDNALGGVVPDEAFGIGTVLYAGTLAENGRPLTFEECPVDFESDSATDPNAANPLGIFEQLLFQLDYVNGQLSQSPIPVPPLVPSPEQGRCNVRGLTDLGHFLINELMKRKMIIELDHSSRKTIDRIMEIAEANGYPGLTSSHDWLYSEELLDRLAADGGTIKRFASARGAWVDKLNRVDERSAKYTVAGVPTTGLASDVNGIASLPGNGGDADTPLYPFTSVDGRVEFGPQVTGDHVFSLYEGRGVAHYGLYPDQIADMQRFTDDRSDAEVQRALRQLFGSAEAFLRQWERTEAWPN